MMSTTETPVARRPVVAQRAVATRRASAVTDDVTDQLDQPEEGGDSESPLPPTENNIALLKLKPFYVIRSEIRDSLRRYVAPKQVAWLDKKTATRYLDKNLIRVELPDDFDADPAPDDRGADQSGAGNG